MWISEIIANFNGISAFDFNFFREIQEYYDDLQLPDLATFISKKDFDGLKNTVNVLENRVYEFYVKNGLKIPVLNDFTELKEYLNQ